MNPTYFIPIIMLWVIVFLLWKKQKRVIIKNILKKKNKEKFKKMQELAKRFIGKECIVYTYDSAQLTGIVKEASDGALVIEKDGNEEIVNLDFVIRIREYPKKKNGKKKSVVID